MNLIEFKLLARKKYNWNYVFIKTLLKNSINDNDVEVNVVENDKIVYVQSPSTQVLETYSRAAIQIIEYSPLILKNIESTLGSSLQLETAEVAAIKNLDKINTNTNLTAKLFVLLINPINYLNKIPFNYTFKSNVSFIDFSVDPVIDPSNVDINLSSRCSISSLGNIRFTAKNSLDIGINFNIKIATDFIEIIARDTAFKDLGYSRIELSNPKIIYADKNGLNSNLTANIEKLEIITFGIKNSESLGLLGNINNGKVTQLRDLDSFSLDYVDHIYDKLFRDDGRTSVKNLEYFIIK